MALNETPSNETRRNKVCSTPRSPSEDLSPEDLSLEDLSPSPRSYSLLSPLHQTVLIALGAAITAVGAFIAIPLPLSPVPIVLQNFFIVLIALVLGPKMGTASVALYLLTGALGLPVFAGGKGGFAHFFGPTGGYLAGFLLSAWITGTLATIGQRKRVFGLRKRVTGGKQKGESEGTHDTNQPREIEQSIRKPQQEHVRLRDAAAAAAGVLSVYLLGLPWLAYKLGLDGKKLFLVGFLPFFPGDLLKAAAAAVLAPQVRKLLRKEFFPEGESSG